MNTLTRNSLGAAAAFAAGALAMYGLYSALGRRAADRPKVLGRFDRDTAFEPENDAQLRERVRERLGHWVSHPRAMEVDVNEGVVRVSGQVLAQELDGLLSQLTGMPGVRKVHNALSVLDDPSGFGETPRERAQHTSH